MADKNVRAHCISMADKNVRPTVGEEYIAAPVAPEGRFALTAVPRRDTVARHVAPLPGQKSRTATMAGFRTHITVSTTLGVGYGAAGLFLLPEHHGELPLATCALAAGLCGVSGMLPDLDSDSGVPIRETMALAAAVVPMLLMRRFARLGMSHESMVLAGAAVYLFVRFGLGALLKRFTVHRGMFHSIPAAAIAGILAFLLCQCVDLADRYYKAGAVVLGFMSHLVVDELWAIDWRFGRLRLKQSFGTAMKFWGESTWANVSTYGKLLLLVALATQDPVWAHETEPQVIQGQSTTNVAVEKIKSWWR